MSGPNLPPDGHATFASRRRPAAAPSGGVRRIAVLGSTGSLGRQALDLCRRMPERLQVIALGASGRHPEALAQQAREFRPRLVAVSDPRTARQLARELSLPGVEIVAGEQAMVEAALHPEVDRVLVLTSGLAGLAPTLRALEAGRAVALANKEVIVAAGDLMDTPRRVQAGQILPVDSEHSAIWQSLRGEPEGAARRLWLTASGGPFWGWPPERLATVTPGEALRHPTWQMGPRVTVDSATLMNKGFEVIEAHHLFGVPCEDIHVVIHRQSVIHSLVELCDGSYKGQLSVPDMRIPLLLALSYPERWPFEAAALLDPAADREASAPPDLRLTLQRPPTEPRAVHLARQAARAGGTFPAVLAAADEAAVEAFLAGRLGFHRLLDVVEAVLEAHDPPGGPPSVEQRLEADRWAREQADRVLARFLDARVK